jgi:Flp pilus assembly protein TadG
MEMTMRQRRRANDDQGAVLVFLAISLVSLVAITGLVIDGGRAYGERRQMQNASDSSAMAATRQLDLYLTGQSTDASLIKEAALDTAETNGASRADVTCDLVAFDRTVLAPCPTTAAIPEPTKSSAAGVRVTTQQTQDTFFMKVVGTDDFTANADATAQIGRPGGSFVAPFVVCGTAPGHIPQLLLPDATSSTGFMVNAAAIGVEYSIYGNDIKNNGRDCGNPSSSFRGNVNTGGTYPLPGEWDTDTGNKNGPTLRLINSGNACAPDFTDGCMVVLPLCPRGNGQGGTGFRIYCTDLGLFEISYVANHDIDAIFRGPATINQGGIVGPADLNGSRIVALTD